MSENLVLSASENSDAEVNADWAYKLAESFKEQWWVFLVTLFIVIAVMIVIKILSKGKIFKFRTILKIVLNCVIAFVLLFLINAIAALFSAAIVPKWYSWILIGVFGILGLAFILISMIFWPGLFVA